MSLHTFDFIRERAQTHGKEIAFIDESHVVTFREFDFYTRKIASYLTSRGVKQGDLVATLAPTYLDWHFTFALHRLGVATMSMNNIKAFNPDVFPDFLITMKAHPGISPERTILLDQSVLESINNSSDEIELTGYKEATDIARFSSTSGTTGQAKYIRYTAESLIDKSERKSPYDFIGLDHVFSMYAFGTGQSHGLALKNLIAGKPFYACFFNDYRLAKFISKNPIRTLYASPAQVASFLDVQTQTGTQFPLLKTVILGGSAPTPQLIDRIKAQLDSQIFNTYGSTEAGGITYEEITNLAEGSPFAGTMLHSDVIMQIVDEDNNLLPQGEVGIIRYQRPGMSTSYFKNPGATAEYFRDGFFYPGDIGSLDDVGRLVLEGRSNEVINLGGVKMNPEVVDKIALAQLGVLDCATFSIPSIGGVEQLALAIVTDQDFSPELFEKVLVKKSPYRVAFVLQTTKIPRNENGKILRSVLSQQYLEQEGQQG